MNELEQRCSVIAKEAATKFGVDREAAFKLAMQEPERAMSVSYIGFILRIVKQLREQEPQC